MPPRKVTIRSSPRRFEPEHPSTRPHLSPPDHQTNLSESSSGDGDDIDLEHQSARSKVMISNVFLLELAKAMVNGVDSKEAKTIQGSFKI